MLFAEIAAYGILFFIFYRINFQDYKVTNEDLFVALFLVFAFSKKNWY